MANQILIGAELVPDWDAAKWLGDTMLTGEALRVEAFGVDWIVLRSSDGEAHAAAFSSQKSLLGFIGDMAK